MAWTTITGTEDNIDENIASFASGVSSIDAFSVTSEARSEVVAVIQYTA